MAPALDPATGAELDALLAEQQRQGRLPSLTVGCFALDPAAVSGEQPAAPALVWSGAAGSLDGRGGAVPSVDTQYRIGSITKTFVAVCLLRARDEGLLALTDPVERHVPGTQVGDATILQLLTHSSGLRAETDGPWWERSPGRSWESLVPGIGRTHAPGQRFHYSNTGFALLGQVLEAVRGRDWFDVVRAEVLEPLGMTRTSLTPLDDDHARGLAVHPHADLLHREPHTQTGAMAPAGQLWSTVTDLGRYAAVLLGRAPHVLSGETAEEMAQPVVVVVDPGEPFHAWGLGVSVHLVDGRLLVGHGGSMPGFLAGLRVDRGRGTAVVGFANATSGWGGPTPYLQALRDVGSQPFTPAPSDADELTGDWWWGTNHYVLQAGSRGVALTTPSGGRAARLRPGTPADLWRAAAANRPAPDERFWVGLDGYFDGEVLRVIRDDTGRPHHLDLGSFRLTRTPYAPDADLPGGPDPDGWH